MDRNTLYDVPIGEISLYGIVTWLTSLYIGMMKSGLTSVRADSQVVSQLYETILGCGFSDVIGGLHGRPFTHRETFVKVELSSVGWVMNRIFFSLRQDIPLRCEWSPEGDDVLGLCEWCCDLLVEMSQQETTVAMISNFDRVLVSRIVAEEGFTALSGRILSGQLFPDGFQGNGTFFSSKAASFFLDQIRRGVSKSNKDLSVSGAPSGRNASLTKRKGPAGKHGIRVLS